MWMQGTVQDDTSGRRMVDGKLRALLAAFAAAPALVELHVQLPDHLAISSKSLVRRVCTLKASASTYCRIVCSGPR